MKKVEIKQVILLHPAKFVCKAFETFAKSMEIQAYTLDQYEPFDYLMADLKPDAVIIHTDIYTGFPEQIQNDLASYNESFKTLIWGSPKDVESCELANDGALVEPVDLGNLEDIFESLLAQIN